MWLYGGNLPQDCPQPGTRVRWKAANRPILRCRLGSNKRKGLFAVNSTPPLSRSPKRGWDLWTWRAIALALRGRNAK